MDCKLKNRTRKGWVGLKRGATEWLKCQNQRLSYGEGQDLVTLWACKNKTLRRWCNCEYFYLCPVLTWVCEFLLACICRCQIHRTPIQLSCLKVENKNEKKVVRILWCQETDENGLLQHSVVFLNQTHWLLNCAVDSHDTVLCLAGDALNINKLFPHVLRKVPLWNLQPIKNSHGSDWNPQWTSARFLKTLPLIKLTAEEDHSQVWRSAHSQSPSAGAAGWHWQRHTASLHSGYKNRTAVIAPVAPEGKQALRANEQSRASLRRSPTNNHISRHTGMMGFIHDL